MSPVRLGSIIAQKFPFSLIGVGKTVNQRVTSLANSSLAFSSHSNSSFAGRNLSILAKSLGALVLGALVFNSKAHCESPCQGFNFDLDKLQSLPEPEKTAALFSLIEECKAISELGRAFEAIKSLPEGGEKDNELWKLSNQCSDMGNFSFSLSIIKEMYELRNKAFEEFIDKYGISCEPKVLIKGLYAILPSESIKDTLWNLAFKRASLQETADVFFEMPKGKEKDEILLKLSEYCFSKKEFSLGHIVIEKIEGLEMQEAALLSVSNSALDFKEYILALQTVSKVQTKEIREKAIENITEMLASVGEYDYAIESVKYLEEPGLGLVSLALMFFESKNYNYSLKALKNMPEDWQDEKEGEELLVEFMNKFFEAKQYPLALELAGLAEKPEGVFAILENRLFEVKEDNVLIEAIKARPEGTLKQKTFWDFSSKLFNAGRHIGGAHFVAAMTPGWQKERAVAELINKAFSEKNYIMAIGIADLMDPELKEKTLKDVINRFLQAKDFGHAWIASLRVDSLETQNELKALINEQMSPLTADECLYKLSNQYFAANNYEVARKIAQMRDPSWSKDAGLWTLWGANMINWGSSWIK